MKFKILSTTFLDALKNVQNIVPVKTLTPIILNVLIEAKDNKLKLVTTDFELSVSASCEAEVLEPGSTTLPVKLLFNSMSKFVVDTVTVEVDAEDKATICCGKTKVELYGLPAKEFPKLPTDQDSNIYILNQQVFREMLRKTFYVLNREQTRRAIRGLLISFKNGKLTVVSTDGHRLALVEQEVEFPVGNEVDFILPLKTVLELQRILSSEEEIEIKVQKSQVCFNLGNVVFYSKLIDETYPNYQQIIPSECEHKIVVDRQLLIDAIERIQVVNEMQPAKFIFENGILVLETVKNSVSFAKDEISIKYTGEKIEILLSLKHVLEPLKALDDDEITININNAQSPIVIKCSIPFIYILMPLRSN